MIPRPRVVLTSLVGILLSTFGLLYILNLDRIQRYTLEWLMVLRPNSFITDLWEHPTMDMNAKVYIFNWTNPEQFTNHSVKPHLDELGPFCFKENLQKVNIVWHDENSTVSYIRKSLFHYDKASSVGKLTDRVVAPNLLAVGLLSKVQNWSVMARNMVDMTLKMYGNDYKLDRSADDWLFKGFATPLVRASKLVPTTLMPDLHFPYERIGYGYPRNGSLEIYGHHNIYTGRGDFSKLGQIARWRYSDVSPAYPQCGQVRGSPGEFHPIPLKRGEPLTYFLPDLCRELQVDFAGTITFEGIEAFVYNGSARNMENANDDQHRRCYCATGGCDENLASGIMDISSCWYGVPVFASYPHFYKADPYYANQVDGLSPHGDRHEMSLIIEPKTGMLLEVKARLMISLLVEPVPFSTTFRKVRKTFFPLAWVDYHIRITPDLLSYVKLLPLSEIIGRIFGCVCVIIGVLLLLWYPRQIYQQKLHMRKIEISNLEARTPPAAPPDQLKIHAEESPLLIGLQYTPKDSAS